MKHLYYTIVVLLVAIYSCFGMPQSQQQQQSGEAAPEMDSSSSDEMPPVFAGLGGGWKKLYSGYEPTMRQYRSLLERGGYPLDKFLADLAQKQNRVDGFPNFGAPWEPIYQKRQVRYRQCYFNPISCFKK